MVCPDPVFLASLCGESAHQRPSATALGTDDVYDYRFASLGAAVEFAKQNNLLGVLLDASLLVCLLFWMVLFALLTVVNRRGFRP